eukprot:358619-Chlamydomonas_euryale.AAC.20
MSHVDEGEVGAREAPPPGLRPPPYPVTPPHLVRTPVERLLSRVRLVQQPLAEPVHLDHKFVGTRHRGPPVAFSRHDARRHRERRCGRQHARRQVGMRNYGTAAACAPLRQARRATTQRSRDLRRPRRRCYWCSPHACMYGRHRRGRLRFHAVCELRAAGGGGGAGIAGLRVFICVLCVDVSNVWHASGLQVVSACPSKGRRCSCKWPSGDLGVVWGWSEWRACGSQHWTRWRNTFPLTRRGFVLVLCSTAKR